MYAYSLTLHLVNNYVYKSRCQKHPWWRKVCLEEGRSQQNSKIKTRLGPRLLVLVSFTHECQDKTWSLMKNRNETCLGIGFISVKNQERV